MSSLVIADIAGTGARLVLYLLIALSVAQLAIVIERAVAFARSRADHRRLRSALLDAVGDGAVPALQHELPARSLEGHVLAAACARADDGPEAVKEVVEAELETARLPFERWLPFLGTLGNNAPFIGLFGTVLGIIHAIADLSASAGAETSRAVLGGISEALILTGVGLMVALPAVAAFNWFQRSLTTRVAHTRSLCGELLSHLKVQRIDAASTLQLSEAA